jgi:hypothetical protein
MRGPEKDERLALRATHRPSIMASSVNYYLFCFFSEPFFEDLPLGREFLPVGQVIAMKQTSVSAKLFVPYPAKSARASFFVLSSFDAFAI